MSATTGSEPLETIRLSAEGTFEYQALLFLPAHAPMDLFMRDSRRGVQLYVGACSSWTTARHSCPSTCASSRASSTPTTCR